MVIAAAVLLCFATGFLLVALAFGRCAVRGTGLLLCLCLSAGFGLAIFSFTYFLARVAGCMRLWIIDFGILAILLACSLIARKWQQHGDHSLNRAESNSAPRSVIGAFVLAACAAGYSALMRVLGKPYGSGWDSFAIWNLHARFLYRGGTYWRDGFSPLIPWSHPDYPLLLPAAIAHFWTILRCETTAVPATVGLIFTFATVGLLFAALDLLGGQTSALIGAMALLCSPFFIELGTWQYADVPLSFFFLATLVLFQIADHGVAIDVRSRRGMLALAGFAAGCAAWTKNEGILFLCAILCARFLAKFLQRPGVRTTSSQRLQLLSALYALIPVLCIILFFKGSIAPSGDLFSDKLTVLQKLGEAWRYGVVLKWYGKEFLRFGHWLLIPVPLLMLAFYFMIRKRVVAGGGTTLLSCAIALGLTVAGYFFIYLITPYDIYWHLRFSLSRLFIQVWPSAIFVFFLRLGPLLATAEAHKLQH